MYHYTECGLDYVFLQTGYRTHDTDHGAGVSFLGVDELDKAVATLVVTGPTRLRGQEVRFLRSQVAVSQIRLAALLGVQRPTVARWEAKPDTPIPGAADRLLRIVYMVSRRPIEIRPITFESFVGLDNAKPDSLHMTYSPDEKQDRWAKAA